MDIIGKLEWDYLGNVTNNCSYFRDTKVWIQTLHTTINRANALVLQANNRCGCDTIIINPKLFLIIKHLEFIRMDGDNFKLGNKLIIFNETQEMNKLFVSFEDKIGVEIHIKNFVGIDLVGENKNLLIENLRVSIFKKILNKIKRFFKPSEPNIKIKNITNSKIIINGKEYE